MQIYFDNTEIDLDKVTGISFDGKEFNENEIFTLGATICDKVTLNVAKIGLLTTPTHITLVENGVSRTFNVDNIQENESTYIYTLVDNMVNFNFRYDASDLINNSEHVETDGTKYVYLIELLQDICNKAGVTLNTQTFLGYQKHITWYDNTIFAREYVSMIAELNGGYAIDDNGLTLVQLSNTPTYTIDLDNCKNYKIGEKHTITRIAIENGAFEPIGNDNGTTIYINSNNVFITEQQDMINIFNIINGYEFYSVDVELGNIPLIRTGNCIALSDGLSNYKFYSQINANYNGGWYGKLHFAIGSNKQEETFSYNGNDDNYKRLKFELDRDKNQVNILIGETQNLSNRTDILATHIDETTGDVREVTTTTGYTFNAEGLNIYKNDTTFNTLINNEGTYYKDGDIVLSQTTKDGTKTKDLDIFGYNRYGEDNINDEPMFIAVKYHNDITNEDGYGHFYNGL